MILCFFNNALNRFAAKALRKLHKSQKKKRALFAFLNFTIAETNRFRNVAVCLNAVLQKLKHDLSKIQNLSST